MPDFVPFGFPRAGFVSASQGRGPAPAADLVVPIRVGEAPAVRPLPTFGAAPGAPRPLFAREEPAPPTPAAPVGPTPEEIAKMVAEAEQRGHRRGRQELQGELDARIEQERRLGVIAEALDRYRATILQEACGDIGGVVIGSLRRLVGEVPELLELLLEARCREAVEQLHSAREVTVRCNPRDQGAALRVIGRRPGWRIVPDPEVVGGCVVSSEGGELDATIDQAFTGLDAALAAWRAERGDG
ncbi:MAG: hypothetical protein JNM72_06795 [Deltaproteobacteria bacterium]|jgi:hypothetical protein|nr:hypothetical protein [Deltaproteobacteria bacterium]